MESLSNVAVANVCWWFALSSKDAMYCTLSVTAVQMYGGWRASRELCWRWLVAVLGPQQKQVDRGTPSSCLQCPHCPQPRPPASVTPERNVPTRGSTVRVVLVIKAGVRMNGVTYIRCCKLLNNWAKPFKQIQMVLAEVGDDPVPAPNFL